MLQFQGAMVAGGKLDIDKYRPNRPILEAELRYLRGMHYCDKGRC